MNNPRRLRGTVQGTVQGIVVPLGAIELKEQRKREQEAFYAHFANLTQRKGVIFEPFERKPRICIYCKKPFMALRRKTCSTKCAYLYGRRKEHEPCDVEKCNTCKYREPHRAGWCYMFAEQPKTCSQYEK